MYFIHLFSILSSKHTWIWDNTHQVTSTYYNVLSCFCFDEILILQFVYADPLTFSSYDVTELDKMIEVYL